MSSQYYPVVGNWYKDEREQRFEVVAADEEENFIEIQFFGGEIDEIDFDAWNLIKLETIPQPEDWTGPYDEIEKDDLGYSDTAVVPDFKTLSLEELD